jgi:ABC-type lipoprotein release transport system permease subunit
LRLASDVDTILVNTENAYDATQVVLRIGALRRTEGLQAVVESEYYESAVRAFGPIFNGLALVLLMLSTGAALSVGALLSVIFRRRVAEFSILRAIGFRDRRIAFLIMTECQLVALVGGGLGVAAAWVSARDRTLFAAIHNVQIAFTAVVTPAVAGITMGALALIAALAVLWPTRTVLRQPVTNGLRDE